MLKWGSITFAIGIALIVLEIFVASKKKEGVQPQDRKRIVGIFWLTLFATALVTGLIWIS